MEYLSSTFILGIFFGLVIANYRAFMKENNKHRRIMEEFHELCSKLENGDYLSEDQLKRQEYLMWRLHERSSGDPNW